MERIPVKRLDLALDAEFLSRAEEWLSEVDARAEVALCAVAQEELESELAKRLASFSSFQGELPHGLEIDCEFQETIGRDRLFAARGAVELVGQSVIIVDCGTALTVDLAKVGLNEGDAKRAIFMGGAIAPGPHLLGEALARGGARLPEFKPTPDASALGKHTKAALAAGIAVGLRGAARELVAGLMEAASDSALPVVLTGGAMPFMTSGEPLASRVIEEPELVHLGLLAALADRRVTS
ncbi:MAG: pantothenate kinase type III [Planctomycetota bacterium]|jgi:pantothenate kinase type III